MDEYATVTANEPEEEEEEGNAESICKQPATNPIGGSRGHEKESAARARSERARNLAGYAMGLAKNPEEDEEEENTAWNCKQLARNPAGGSQGWEKENAPTLAPSTLVIHGGASGIFTKQATTLPAERNTPRIGTKSQ